MLVDYHISKLVSQRANASNSAFGISLQWLVYRIDFVFAVQTFHQLKRNSTFNLKFKGICNTSSIVYSKCTRT